MQTTTAQHYGRLEAAEQRDGPAAAQTGTVPHVQHHSYAQQSAEYQPSQALYTQGSPPSRHHHHQQQHQPQQQQQQQQQQQGMGEAQQEYYRPQQHHQGYPPRYAHEQQQQQQQYHAPSHQQQGAYADGHAQHATLLHARSGAAPRAQAARRPSVPEHLQPRPFQSQRRPQEAEQHQPAQAQVLYPPQQAQQHGTQYQQAAAAAQPQPLVKVEPGTVPAPEHGATYGGEVLYGGHAVAAGAAAPTAYPAQGHYGRGSSSGNGAVGGGGTGGPLEGARTGAQAASWEAPYHQAQQATAYTAPYQQQQHQHQQSLQQQQPAPSSHAARYSPLRLQAAQEHPEPQEPASYIPLQPRPQPAQQPAPQQQPHQPQPAPSSHMEPVRMRPPSAGGQGPPPVQPAPLLTAALPDGPPPLPAQLKPIAIAPAPAASTAPAAPAGFVQLVAQPGGIQVDQTGGLRLVLTATGDARLASVSEAALSTGVGTPCGGVNPNTAMHATQAQAYPGGGGTAVKFEPLQPSAQEWAQTRAYGTHLQQQPQASGPAWDGHAAGPAGDPSQQHYVSAKRLRPGSEQFAAGAAPGPGSDVGATAGPGAAGVGSNGVRSAPGGPSTAPAAAAPTSATVAAAAGGGPAAAPAAGPDVPQTQPSGRSARVPIPVPQPRAQKAGETQPRGAAAAAAPPAAPAPVRGGERPAADKARAEPAKAQPAPPLAEAVQKGEKLENTIKATRADEDMLPVMLPQLLRACEQRISELSRAISGAKSGAAGAKEAAAAAAKAAAASADKDAAAAAKQTSTAAASATPELGPNPLAFLVERSICKLFPRATPEHDFLRVCAAVLLADCSEEGRLVYVNGQEMRMRACQDVGARLCNVQEVADAAAAARAAGVGSTTQLLRSHELFEVREVVHPDHPTSRQWLVRLRAERLPGYSSIQRSLRRVVDALLPPPPPSSSPSAAAAGRRGGGESEGAGDALPRPAGAEPESADEADALRSVALHLLNYKPGHRGLHNDTLEAVAAALPSRLDRRFGGSSGQRTLRALLEAHPLFWVAARPASGSAVAQDECVGLDTNLMFEYEHRARQHERQQAAGRKRKAGDDGGAEQDLSSWWRDRRGLMLKRQRNA